MTGNAALTDEKRAMDKSSPSNTEQSSATYAGDAIVEVPQYTYSPPVISKEDAQPGSSPPPPTSSRKC
jgi:hypothetical protein